MRKNFEEWEKTFILLTFPTESYQSIAQILNRSEGTISTFIYSLGKKKPPKIKIGDRFGKLLIVGIGQKFKYSNKWICLCDCGNNSEVKTGTLLFGHTKSCGCGRIEAISHGTNLIPGWYYGQIEKNAKSRNIEFQISIEYIEKLLISQDFKCFLSGLPINLFGKNIRKTKKLSTASLDRIDSSKGYIEGNLQWVHSDINIMKGVYEQEYFIQICNLISGNHQSTQEFKNATYRWSVKKIEKNK